MIKTKNQAMLEGLRRLKATALDINKRRALADMGICQALDDALIDLRNERFDPRDPDVVRERATLWRTYLDSGLMLSDVMREWPEYSGVVMYPVPSPDKDMSPGVAYAWFDKWSRRTKYGKARWRLLDHCIANFEAKVAEENDQ